MAHDLETRGYPSEDQKTKPAAIARVGLSNRSRMTQRGFFVTQIIALVKPFRAEAVLLALGSINILAGTVREAMGYGRQKNRLHRYLGSEYNNSFLPKVEITIFVEDEDVPAVLRAIVSQARTGRIGDGKILVIKCRPEAVDLGA